MNDDNFYKRYIAWKIAFFGCVVVSLIVLIYILQIFSDYVERDKFEFRYYINCHKSLYTCNLQHSQKHAQLIYDWCFELVGYDVHELDEDGNGIACEGI